MNALDTQVIRLFLITEKSKSKRMNTIYTNVQEEYTNVQVKRILRETYFKCFMLFCLCCVYRSILSTGIEQLSIGCFANYSSLEDM